MRRVLLRLLVLMALLAVLLYGAGGWYFAGRINEGALAVRVPEPKVVEVLRLTGDQLTVRETGDDVPALAEDMTYGLAWQGGRGEVHGAPVDASGSEDRTQVTRSFRLTDGAPPAPGTTVRVDRDIYPPEEDPSDALGTSVQQVEYRSPAGAFPAWYVPGRSGDGGTWAVFVHGGLGSDRSEALRAMRTTTRLGLPSLAITYRNDADVPQDASGRYQFGRTEWRDLEGAVRYAVQHGASDVALVGYSMGGAITAAFLRRSPLASKVSRVVLDAPNLDLRSTVEYGADQLALPVIGAPPTSLVRVAERIASARYHLDWDAVDYVDDTSWVTVPTLVFQGTEDRTAPMAPAEQLQKSKPDLVTLVKVSGAGHVESWNTDPRRYDRRLASFLSDPHERPFR